MSGDIKGLRSTSRPSRASTDSASRRDVAAVDSVLGTVMEDPEAIQRRDSQHPKHPHQQADLEDVVTLSEEARHSQVEIPELDEPSEELKAYKKLSSHRHPQEQAPAFDDLLDRFVGHED